MEIKNVRWVGIHTQHYDATVRLFEEVLGMRRNFTEPTTVEFVSSEGDEVQVIGPGDPYFAFFQEHATGPVPLFEVDDLRGARRRLEEASVEIVGPSGQDSKWDWIHFRGPDGHLYEVSQRREGDQD